MLFTTSTTTEKLAAAIALISTDLCATIFLIWSVSVLSFVEISPNLSTDTNSKFSAAAICKINSPSAAFINSPLLFNNFNAFHSLGLWLAVRIIPPSAFKETTAISTVGVVLKSVSITSIPNPLKVAATILLTILPLMRPSLPITTFLFSVPFSDCVLSQVP